jgi:membrane protease subunit (stomatin/prohibitin family)
MGKSKEGKSIGDRIRGVLEVIEYLDPSGEEIVHRVPEEGSGEIVFGSQLIVRESQAAIFFRDGRAMDVFGPGRHTLTTMNLPLLVNYLKIPFGSKSPFRAEVVFVNLKDYNDIPWISPKPIAFRDDDLGVVRLDTQGKFAFQVQRAQQFVNQIVGTRGLYQTDDIVGYLQSIVVSRLNDLLGSLDVGLLDLPAQYDELGAGVRARAAEDFAAMGLNVKSVYITAIGVPPEVEKALDERASMGAIGNMQAYLQFKAARALGDAAQATGEGGGSLTGAGVGLGAGMGLGATMAGAITQAMQGPMVGAGASAQQTAGAGAQETGLGEAFETLKQTVDQQIVLTEAQRSGAKAALETLLAQLTSPEATLEDVRATRATLTENYPWLADFVANILNSPAGLQALGRISARSL